MLFAKKDDDLFCILQKLQYLCIWFRMNLRAI